MKTTFLILACLGLGFVFSKLSGPAAVAVSTTATAAAPPTRSLAIDALQPADREAFLLACAAYGEMSDALKEANAYSNEHNGSDGSRIVMDGALEAAGAFHAFTAMLKIPEVIASMETANDRSAVADYCRNSARLAEVTCGGSVKAIASYKQFAKTPYELELLNKLLGKAESLSHGVDALMRVK